MLLLRNVKAFGWQHTLETNKDMNLLKTILLLLCF